MFCWNHYAIEWVFIGDFLNENKSGIKMNSKTVWHFLMINVLLLWVALIAIGNYIFPDDLLKSLSLVLILFVIHVFEVPIAYKIGMKKNLSATMTVSKILLLGFTWWVPLKKGVIER